MLHGQKKKIYISGHVITLHYIKYACLFVPSQGLQGNKLVFVYMRALACVFIRVLTNKEVSISMDYHVEITEVDYGPRWQG